MCKTFTSKNVICLDAIQYALIKCDVLLFDARSYSRIQLQNCIAIFYMFAQSHTINCRCVASKMKSMKKRLSESPTAVLEVGDNQLHAALSMEARTRSPLPPSPTTSTTLHDIEIERLRTDSTHSDLSVKKLIHSFEEHKRPQPPIKPPRKFIGEISTSDYETICKYDEIEVRSNAWKTLGTDNVNHTENIQNEVEEDEEYISWGRNARRQPLETKENNFPRKASKIITAPSTPDNDSYDKLNFFGSSSKLNSNKSDYKQILATSMNPLAPIPSFNPYDEVSTNLEGIRLADDSHLGYATVRKVKEPEHQYHNEDAYTIISKPKRV